MTEALEKSNIQPKKLFFYQNPKMKCVFQAFKQIEFYKKWTSLVSLNLITLKELNRQLGNLVSNSVTNLELSSSDNVPFDKILASFPSVIKLNIDYQGSFITFDSYDNKTSYTNLRYLTLSGTIIMGGIVQFFNNATPNLKELTWCTFTNFHFCTYSSNLYIYSLTGLKLNMLHLYLIYRYNYGNVSKIFCPSVFSSAIASEHKVYLEVCNLREDIDSYMFQVDNEDGGKYKYFIPVERIEENDVRKLVKVKLIADDKIKEIAVGDDFVL